MHTLFTFLLTKETDANQTNDAGDTHDAGDLRREYRGSRGRNRQTVTDIPTEGRYTMYN